MNQFIRCIKCHAKAEYVMDGNSYCTKHARHYQKDKEKMADLTPPVRFLGEITASKNMGDSFNTEDGQLVPTGWWLVYFPNGLQVPMADTDFRANFEPIPQAPPAGVNAPR